MKKLIDSGSGSDDMGAGIAWGCIKWVIIIAGVVFITLSVLSLLKII